MEEKKQNTKLAVVLFEKRVSLQDLKEKTGISPSTLSQLKNGHRKPAMATAIKISEALGVKVEDIF